MTEDEKEAKKSEASTPASPKDELVQTQHSLTIDGREIRYTVTCGTMVLKRRQKKRGRKKARRKGKSHVPQSSLSPTRAMGLRTDQSAR